MKWVKKNILTIILIALVVMCISIMLKMSYDINELYKHIDLLNLFYRSLIGDAAVGV